MLKKVLYATVAIIIIGAILVPMSQAPVMDRTLVYVLAGQSNSAYLYEDLDVTNKEVGAPASDCYYFGDNEGPSVYYKRNNLDSFEFYKMYSGGMWDVGNLEAPIASKLSQGTHNDIVIINAGIANRSITQLLSSDETAYIDALLTRALTKLNTMFDNIELSGVIWAQGESDRTTPIPDYVNKFGEIIDFYNEYGFEDFYIIQSSINKGGTAHEAQEIIIDTYDNVRMASTRSSTFTVENGLLQDDNLHYTQRADDLIGQDVGACILNVVAPATSSIYPLLGVLAPICLVVVVSGLIISITVSRRT